jgi:hypothetical protein
VIEVYFWVWSIVKVKLRGFANGTDSRMTPSLLTEAAGSMVLHGKGIQLDASGYSS